MGHQAYSTFQAWFGVTKESVPRAEGSPCPALLPGVTLSQDARVRSQKSELPLPRGGHHLHLWPACQAAGALPSLTCSTKSSKTGEKASILDDLVSCRCCCCCFNGSHYLCQVGIFENEKLNQHNLCHSGHSAVELDLSLLLPHLRPGPLDLSPSSRRHCNP